MTMKTMHELNQQLLDAAIDGDLKRVKLALKKGADIEAKEDKWTSLMWASFYGNLSVIKFLIGRGSDLNKQDKEGQTPLMLALINEHTEAIKLLIDSGADINIKNKEEKTVLMLAQEENHHDETCLIKIAIENQALAAAIQANQCSSIMFNF